MQNRKFIKYVIILISFGILFALLYHMGLTKIVEYILKMGVSGALLLLLFTYIENMFVSLALKEAIGNKANLFKTMTVSMTGAFVNIYVPFDAGEVVKATLLKKMVGGKSAVSGTIIWNYLYKLSKSTALTILATTLFILDQNPLTMTLFILSILSYSLYFGYKLLLSQGISEKLIQLLYKIKIIRKNPEEIMEHARDIDAIIKNFYHQNKKGYYIIIIYQVFAKMMAFFAVWLLLYLLSDDYSLITALISYTGFELSSYIVLALPNRVGAEEGAGYAFFAFIQMDPELGLMIQFLIRLKNTFTLGSAIPFTLLLKKSDSNLEK